MQSEKSSTVICKTFDPDAHLSGVGGICRSLQWNKFRHDANLT